jgi:hypothetical protein
MPATTPRRCRPRLECLEDRTALSTTALSVSVNPATVGQAVTLTATVTESGGDALQPGKGSPAGTVTFLDGSTPLATVTVSPESGTTNQGVASFTTTGLGVGGHVLSANYSGEIFLMFITGTSTSNPVAECITPLPPPPPTLTDVTPLVSVTRQNKCG